MKRGILLVLVVLLGLVLALPDTGNAGGRGGRSGGGYRGGHGGYHGGGGGRYYGGYRHYGGWYGPGLFVGVYPSPWYYAPVVPPPVYVEPAPVYAAPAPAPAYAYPDPAYTQQYNQPQTDGSAGQWVTVPGQWVDGKWVAEHQVRVP